MTSTIPADIRAQLRPAAPMTPAIPDEYERPAAELVRPAAEVEGDPLISIFGVPFDTSILGRRGAKDGPTGVRSGLRSLLCYEPGLGIDLSEAPRIADYGDIDVRQTDLESTWEQVSDVTEAIARQGRPFVAIGGDHGLTFPLLRGFCRAVEGRVGVINVDCHFDVRISHHGELASGVPFRLMLEELGDSVRGANFTEIGIGGWLNTKRYHDYLREHDVRVITGREIWRGDVSELAREAVERAADGTDAIYLSFDIDAIEGAVVRGTNVPAVEGLRAIEAEEIVWQFAQHPKALAMDVMEVSPSWDSTDLSNRMAASLVLNFAAGCYARRGEADEASGGGA